MKKLNLGCGKDILKGYINLDIAKLPGVDIVCDIEKEKLPFEDNSINNVYTNNVLEHIKNLEFVMEEIHRILKPNGKVQIIVPHYSTPLAFGDPTHKRFFCYYTFDYFCPKEYRIDKIDIPDFYYNFKFKMLNKKLIFGHNYLFQKILNKEFNSSKYLIFIWEFYFSMIIRAQMIEVIMQPIK